MVQKWQECNLYLVGFLGEFWRFWLGFGSWVLVDFEVKFWIEIAEWIWDFS
ncbi:hypothetical protein [Helicobacter sp. 11S02596-1]|uniref:hypothetical protein n=1 Tax=Helicobacter sp. 11S02596-1 TaxID=1476194 RepID=UPI0015DE4AF6|nr:hypothetical protein [Helicobacter sp. 11S02596-1]